MITRRAFLVLACAAAAPARAQLPANIAQIRKRALDAAIDEVVGAAPVRTGRVKLDLPPLVDNGNTVPLSVTMEEKIFELREWARTRCRAATPDSRVMQMLEDESRLSELE